METCRMDVRRASFTVEATFIVSICIWIIIFVFYLAMYAHDCTALYSLGQNYLETAYENGRNPGEATAAEEMQKYLQKHLMLCKVGNVSVNKGILSVKAEFTYEANVSVPFVKNLLTGKEGKTLVLSHEKMQPAEQMWNHEIINAFRNDS